MTKTAAIEGTAILATDFSEMLLNLGVSKEIINRGAEFIKDISVLKEALILREVGVNSMHDPTEGGILCGLSEIAYSSNVKIIVWEEKIPIANITRIICSIIHINMNINIIYG